MSRFRRVLEINFCCIFLIVSTVSCQGLFNPDFDIAFSTPEGEPVFIEMAVYDDSWTGRGGIMSCCWKSARAVNIVTDSKPIPEKIFIRWFNYKQQKFYESTVHLPKNTAATLRKIPKSEFSVYTLTTGVLPDGEVVVWVSDGGSELISTWVEVARAKGHEVEGDPGDYRSQTEDLRKRGEI